MTDNIISVWLICLKKSIIGIFPAAVWTPEVRLLSSCFSAEGFSVSYVFQHYRPGDEAFLPCFNATPSVVSCRDVEWWYYSHHAPSVEQICNGDRLQGSVRAARITLGTRCSLVISDITAEDVGLYACQQTRGAGHHVVFIYLSVLTSEFLLAEKLNRCRT